MSRRASIARAAGSAVAAVSVLAACSSTARSTTSTPTSAATSTPTSAATGSVRGEPVSAFACPGPGSAAMPSRSVPAASVTELLVCSPRVPNGGEGTSVAVPRSSPHFGPLLSALSAADMPHSTGPCPLYADVAQPVVARTATGILLVHIPVDGCDHNQGAAATALRSARGG